MTISKNVQQGSFLLWLMSRQGVSMSLIAGGYGCTLEMVSSIIWGKRKSMALQEFVAQSLGFESWDALKEAEREFNAHNDRLLRKLSA